MATLRAVVETATADGGVPWPTAEGGYRWETLGPETGPAVIGTVMAAAASWCRPEDADEDALPTAAEALGWIAASDYLVITAGVRASDDSGSVYPGCCCELNDWHGWSDRERRSEMWLGHSPQPWIEESAAGFTVHQDKEDPGRPSITIPAEELPQLLTDLRSDLTGFLTAVERWATEVGGDARLAAAVVANIDRHVGISGG